MNLYVVTTGDYSDDSDYQIRGIFSSREFAREFAREWGEIESPSNIEEFTLDEHCGEKVAEIYRTRVKLDDGSIDIQGSYREVVPRGWSEIRIAEHYAWGYSIISQQHADKLAGEARQEWLRRKTQPEEAAR